MFNYLFNRWIISKRFEKVGSGYIYRRRADLPGIQLTEDERADILLEFRHRYWKTWLIVLGGMSATIILVALAYVIVGFSETVMQITLYGLVTGWIIYLLREQQRWLNLPEVQFADRVRVPSTLGSLGWFGRFERLSQQRTWPVHIILLAIYGTIAWLLIPASFDEGVLRWFFFASFALCVALAMLGVALKVRGPTH